MAAAIPWYHSPQTIGLITTAVAAAVALFPKLGTAFGLTSPTAISTAVENVAGVIALIAPVVGTLVRAKSTDQPITLTKADAEAHPATIAAETVARVNSQNAHTAALVVANQQRRSAAAAAAADMDTIPAPIPAPKVDPTKPWGK